MDDRDILVGRYSEIFDLARNSREIEIILDKKIEILDELYENGILSAFINRKNGNIFRENGLTSEETAEFSKLAKESYLEIQKAALYNLEEPEQAKRWISALTPYLNNPYLSIDSFTHSGIPSLENPLESVLEELESKNYTELKAKIITEEDKKHNQIVNAYNIIKKFDFKTADKAIIDKQLEIIKPVVENQEIISIVQNIKDYKDAATNIEEYKSRILHKGAMQTILDILEKNTYHISQEIPLYNYEEPGMEPHSFGMTIEQLEHNYVCAMYHEIANYGLLIEPLKEQIDKQQLVLSKVTEMEEVQEYLDKMEIRTNYTTFSDDDLSVEEIEQVTNNKKIALPSFIERFISKVSKPTKVVDVLTDDEKVVKQKLEDMKTANYTSFAYLLRDLKKYINNPKNTLNLTDGTNVIEEILNKAESLNLTKKSAIEIIKDNPNDNASLIHYAKNQISDLIEYGCFLTSYCNDIIKKNGINLDTFKQEPNVEVEESELQLPSIKIDTKEFLESIIESSNLQKENDVKVMKKVMAKQEKENTNIETKSNTVLNNQIELNMTDIIKKITKPGMVQTDEENKLIQDLWKVKNDPTEEMIKEVSEKLENLYPTQTKEVILEAWNGYISQFQVKEDEKSQEPINERISEEEKAEIEEQQAEETIVLDKKEDTTTTEILAELININNTILEETGFEKGREIAYIQDEIERLTETLNSLEQKDNSSLDNSLRIIETITNSEVKDNENFETYLANITEQRNREIQELTDTRTNLITIFDTTAGQYRDALINDFNNSKKVSEELKQDKKANKDLINNEKEYRQLCKEIINSYEEVMKLTENRKKGNQSIANNSKIASEQEKVIAKATELISSAKENEIYQGKESQLENLNKIVELMSHQLGISKTNSEIEKIQVELSQLQADYNKTDITSDRIKARIKQLEDREKLLSFNPQMAKEEIERLISEKANEELVSEKLDEIIAPIIVFNEEKEIRLIEDIEALENKISDKANYIDVDKIELEIKKKDSINSQIAEKTERIEELRKLLETENTVLLLENHKSILLEQQANYEEEKEILLQWNVEESESNQDTRDAIEQLFNESKNNLDSIKLEIDDCISQIEELNTSKLNVEEINSEIAKLEEEKASLETKHDKLISSLEKKTSAKYMNKEMYLSDVEELDRKKRELELVKSTNLEELKESFLTAYTNEKNNTTTRNNESAEEVVAESQQEVPLIEKKEDVFELPGALENGNEIKSDGTIVEKEASPLPLPGVLENGDVLNSDWTVDSNELDEEEIEEITEASPSLLDKAKAKLGKAKDAALAWFKKHPKLAATIGTAIAVVVIGATIAIKSLSGESVDKVDDVPLPKDTIETVNDEITNSLTETEEKVDEAIAQVEQEETIEEENNFETSYESVVDDILAGEKDVYISSDRAINDQGAIGVDNLYKPSFENADVGAIYKLEDGQPVKISLEEAENIVENGGTVSVAVENEEVGIGFVAIGGNDTVEENTTGISK